MAPQRVAHRAERDQRRGVRHQRVRRQESQRHRHRERRHHDAAGDRRMSCRSRRAWAAELQRGRLLHRIEAELAHAAPRLGLVATADVQLSAGPQCQRQAVAAVERHAEHARHGHAPNDTPSGLDEQLATASNDAGSFPKLPRAISAPEAIGHEGTRHEEGHAHERRPATDEMRAALHHEDREK
jgi:hypothetical protein